MSNYQKDMDKKLEKIMKTGMVPRLLLHSCCAPCSSYVLEYLSRYFQITVFYYNPNITDEEEYRRRVEEQKRLISVMEFQHPVSFVEGKYEPERFFEVTQGLEQAPEGGKRCKKCFELRLSEAAEMADKAGFDYFATTLTVSPQKDAKTINKIGEEIAEQYEVLEYLPSDFKKNNGYKRSVELSTWYELYRQDYCGCVYSKR